MPTHALSNALASPPWSARSWLLIQQGIALEVDKLTKNAIKTEGDAEVGE